MIPFLVQTLFLLAAGVALFLLWRTAVPQHRWLRLVVAAGFLARAIGGQAMFWISWGNLPFGRSLQLGNGLWVIAPDATFYFPEAIRAAETGWNAILLFDRSSASPSYVQTLAAAIWFLGGSVAIGVLINLFSYLGTVAILQRWSREAPELHRAVALAIVAFSLSPSLILWSLQPLKDSLFQMLFVAFVAACRAWQAAWNTPRALASRLRSCALLMVLMFAIAGMRWYLAGALLAGAAIFLAIVAFRSAEPLRLALPSAAVALLLLTQSLAISARSSMPPALAAVLTPATAIRSLAHTPAALLASVDQTRRGFDSTSATTIIKLGRRLETNTPLQQGSVIPLPLPVVTPSPRPSSPVPSDGSARDSIRAFIDAQVAAWNGNDLQARMAGFWNSPDFELISDGKKVRGWRQTRKLLSLPSSQGGTITLSHLDVGGPAASPVVTGQWTYDAAGGQRNNGDFEIRMLRVNGKWKIARFALLPSIASSPLAAAARAAQPAVAPLRPPFPSPARNDDAEIRELFTRLARTWNANEPGLLMTCYWSSPELQFVDGEATVRGFDRLSASCRRSAERSGGLGLLTITDVRTTVSGDDATATGRWSETSKGAAIVRPFAVALHHFPDAGWKITLQKFQPAISTQSRAARLLSGVAALFLPRTLGQHLDLFEIDGGYGMLWFTELDTLVFDGMLLIVAVGMFLARRERPWRSSLAWLLIATTILVTLPVAYAVNNFGTLFRLREMIFLGLLLLPLSIRGEAGVVRAQTSSP